MTTNSHTAEGAQSGDASELLPLLQAISRAVRQLVGAQLADLGVQPGQDQVLLELANGEAIVSNELARALAIRPATLSKTGSILESRGWITRKKTCADSRHVFLQLTDEGREVVESVREVHADIDRMLSNGLRSARALEAVQQRDAALLGSLSRLR